jgi:hypothetical protein
MFQVTERPPQKLLDQARAAKAMPIQRVVDDPEWQEVRKSLVGRWVKDHRANVEALRAYLQRHPLDPMAVRRVYNVLTGSVHRAGHTAGQVETDQLRLEVRICWRWMLGESLENVRGAI